MSELNPYQSNAINKFATIEHGFFGRLGGVSKGIYKGLNCGFGSNDDAKNVKQNRLKVCDYFGISLDQLVNPYQIHSNIAQYIDTPYKKDGPRIDAFVTDKSNLAIAILTADCAPILFCDPINKIIGAAHAGWQGAFGGVIENTIEQMLHIGARVENITAAIGPCIEQSSYEVGQEYYDRFIENDSQNHIFFEPAKNEKYHFALKQYCAMRLKKAQIAEIDILPHDTCELEEEFFSNRRRTKANEPDYGRNISVIMLKNE